MELKFNLSNSELRIRKMIDIFGCMEPFSKLAERERDVFAEYINGYLSRKGRMTKKEIFKTLFEYDFTLYISNRLSEISGTSVSMDTIRNYTSKLRSKGVLDGRSIPDGLLLLFEKLENKVTFVLNFKE